MRFSPLISLLALILIENQSARAEFVCDDKSPGRAANNQGYCTITDPQSGVVLVKQASATNAQLRKFTCAPVKISDKPTTGRYCCALNNKGFTPYGDGIFIFAGGDIKRLCYSR